MEREAKEHLASLFAGVRDGYIAGNIGTGKVKTKRRFVPVYLQEVERPRGLVGAALDKAVDGFMLKIGRR